MNFRTIRSRTRSTGRARRLPAGARRPALLLGIAAAGALAVNVLAVDAPDAGGSPALAESRSESVSIAEQLGITDRPADTPEELSAAVAGPLGELAASRSERDADQAAAAEAQAAADQAELDRRAAEDAARVEAERQAAERAAAEEAARVAAAEAAAAEQARAAAAEAAAASRAAAPAPPPAPAPSAPAPSGPAPSGPAPSAPAPSAPAGSFQQYALAQLGGNAGEFSCLESLWGKESGWNPNAQNPRSSAYGIPQFLDSTWAGTGIAKTSDGYRQIDAGLVYIENRYGSPCSAWAHSQAKNWY